MTIASDEIGVVISMSSVCFSRSRLIAPAVAAGVRNTTWSVSSIRIAAKMPCPIDAEAYAAEDPNPLVKERSISSSTIQAKPPSSSR